ncbi:FAD:protein FMN transferase [Methylobacterium nodulans]|uniref:FAD:protein FMN transferase n=1 Tax=Methylobacterium nodulans (strain LMG 21967 / CNCM I-2342 / ORS 2060) TaxID=460265 RepID=B8IJ65_METNO|nr:FAD:protein FMN transferase [Methylobacterium nodulans]ACL56080.1 ApbE family lipoprotein [Methylobacterium nodulans ORS 2060]
MRRVLIPCAVPAIGRALQDGTLAEWSGETMGTTWSVKAVVPAGCRTDGLAADLARLLDGIDREMSQWRPDSDLSRFNRAPAGSWVRLPRRLHAVLGVGLDLARRTQGAYDPTIGALADLWGFGPSGPILQRPGPAAIAAAQARSGWSRVRLDPAGEAAFQPGGVQLDLSSIAKGYAVDALSEALGGRGLASHLAEIGGELRGTGVKPDRQPWWVGLEDPLTASAETIVALHGLSVATSGDYRRVLACGAERHGHTLDPRTGRPRTNDLLAVTVLHPSCMIADAAATALLVLGREAGLDHADRHGLAARFLFRTADGDAGERMSASLRRMLL